MILKQYAPAGLILLALVASLAALAACGGDSEPETRTFDLEISDAGLNLDRMDMDVKQGDTVTLRIDTDEHGTFHLHGYDIEREVGPDDTATMEFLANATGKFDITFHPGGESEEHEEEEHDEGHEGEEKLIGSLRVEPR